LLFEQEKCFLHQNGEEFCQELKILLENSLLNYAKSFDSIRKSGGLHFITLNMTQNSKLNKETGKIS
jgi:hypothetical protein